MSSKCKTKRLKHRKQRHLKSAKKFIQPCTYNITDSRGHAVWRRGSAVFRCLGLWGFKSRRVYRCQSPASVVCCQTHVTPDGVIPHPEESYGLYVCLWVWLDATIAFCTYSKYADRGKTKEGELRHCLSDWDFSCVPWKRETNRRTKMTDTR